MVLESFYVCIFLFSDQKLEHLINFNRKVFHLYIAHLFIHNKKNLESINAFMLESFPVCILCFLVFLQ